MPGPEEDELEEQIGRLQSLLKEEQQRRRQAERDFLDLMESVEQASLNPLLCHLMLVSSRL